MSGLSAGRGGVVPSTSEFKTISAFEVLPSSLHFVFLSLPSAVCQSRTYIGGLLKLLSFFSFCACAKATLATKQECCHCTYVHIIAKYRKVLTSVSHPLFCLFFNGPCRRCAERDPHESSLRRRVPMNIRITLVTQTGRQNLHGNKTQLFSQFVIPSGPQYTKLLAGIFSLSLPLWRFPG